jgi:ferrous iron transport protein A
MRKKLTELRKGEKGKIVDLDGGNGFKSNLRSRGVREGKELVVVARHPMKGPIVISIDNRDTAIGRGMTDHIIVEV